MFKRLFISIIIATGFIFIIPLSVRADGLLLWSQTNNLSTGSDVASAVAVDATGIYVVGGDNAAGTVQWRMEKRSLTNGSLLWSQTYNTSSIDAARGVAVDSSGVYIVGWANGDRWRIEKRNLTDGSLLWSQESNPSSYNDEPEAVAIDVTGIYIAGWDQGADNGRWRIEKRSLTNGSLIWAKNDTNPSTWIDHAEGIAVDSTGVYVVGTDYSQGSSNAQWRMEKRGLTDGSLLWSQNSNPSTLDDTPYEVAVDSSGIYVVGTDSAGGGQWRIEKRSLTNGSLLWSQNSNPSASGDTAYGVAVDSTGVYIVGYDSAVGGGQWRIEKRSLTNGSLLWSQVSNLSADWDVAYAVAVDSSAMYIVGADRNTATTAEQFRIEKRRSIVPQYTLTVNRNVIGPGSNTDWISSSPAGISSCTSSTCSANFSGGAFVTLYVQSTSLNYPRFTSWTGCDSLDYSNPPKIGYQQWSYTPYCEVTLNSNKTVTANFSKYNVSVSNGTGGTVTWTGWTGNPLQSGASSSTSNEYNTTVTLTATPFAGYKVSSFSGDCSNTNSNTCSFTVLKNSLVDVNYVKVQQTLTVNKQCAGATNGTVTSSPAGINCGASCSNLFDYGTSVTLTASNTGGAVFQNWSGACTGTGSTCIVNMDADKSVSACFGQTGTGYTLSVSKSGAGTGTVTSSPAGINCGSDCSETYNSGTSVTLTASASAGSTFTGWSGACSGTGSCALTMNSNQSATANFSANAPAVTTGVASSVTSSGATLNGSANPNGLATTAWFEWGTSSNLSTFTSTPSQNLGNGTSAVSYSESGAGLSPSTTYYYRAAASNSSGTAKGSILSFTTTAAAAAGVSVSPTNLTVTPGDPCFAALQPTLSWDLSSAMWFTKGWAWSTNIRWISFNSSNCDTDNDGKSNGGAGCPVAGTAMSAYSVKIDSSNGNFSGYAWSSRVGWIAFGDYNGDGAINASDESISGAPCSGTCRAKLNLSNNQVTGWARVLRYKSFGGDRGWIKLSGTATNGSTYGIYKNGNNLEGWVWGSENIGWISFSSANSYSGKIPGKDYGVAIVAPSQSAYRLEVSDRSDFPVTDYKNNPGTGFDTDWVTSASRTVAVQTGALNYGKTYYWRVNIRDTENKESDWVNGPSFATAAHQYPKVDFEWKPKTPSALETVEFKDKSIVYGGTSIANWLWTFQDATCEKPATGCESVQNPQITFNEVAEKSNKSVSLKVTDSDGFSCTLNKSIPVNVKLPEIKEVAPKR